VTVQTTTSDAAFAARIRALRAAQWFAAEYAALKSADLSRVRATMTRPWARHQAISCLVASAGFGLFGWAFGVSLIFLAMIPLGVAVPVAGDVLAKRHRTGEPLTGRVVADVLVTSIAVTVPIIAGAVIFALVLQRFLGGGAP
jgi:uncharacterized BrkB/YihY/UPF0761 family membrane protein